MHRKTFYVYLLCNIPFGVFYVGLTSDLCRRMQEHREGIFDGFTKQYNVKRLVYYEIYEDADEAFNREKRLKRWSREWKINAITQSNAEWNDLYETVCQ